MAPKTFSKESNLSKEEQKLEEPIQINLKRKKNNKASSPKPDPNNRIQFKMVDGKIKLITPDVVINKDEVLKPDEERQSFSKG